MWPRCGRRRHVPEGTRTTLVTSKTFHTLLLLTLVPRTCLHTYTLWPGHLEMSFTLWQVKSFPPCWCCAAKLEGTGQSDGASRVACGIVSAPVGGITCAGSAPEFPWLCPRQTD